MFRGKIPGKIQGEIIELRTEKKDVTRSIIKPRIQY